MKLKIRTRIRDNRRLLIHSLMWTGIFIILASLSITGTWLYSELVFDEGLTLYPTELISLGKLFLAFYSLGLLACLWEWWSESCEREDDE
ncbi:MAG: hypothetical protein IJV36_08320 [Prevotella sp.]|nr:hypothetical protein [Prevotella sp.]